MLLITPQEVIAMAFTPREKISPTTINPIKIDLTQEHFLLPRLGSRLFGKLSSTLAPDHFTQEYLKPALAFYVRYAIMGDMVATVDDHGVMLFSSNRQSEESAGKTAQKGSQQQSSTATASSSDKTTQTKAATQEQTTSGSSTNHATDNKTTTTTNKSDGSVDGSLIESMGSGSGSLSRTTTDHKIISETLTSAIESVSSGNDSAQNSTSTQDKSTMGSDKVVADNRTNTQNGSTTNEALRQQNAQSELQSLRVASMAEIQTLRSRALYDANILMHKAIRYLESNTVLYPEYQKPELFYF
ncbi:MAG: hypothetical protein RR066_08295 [Mucinivorans sp.]